MKTTTIENVKAYLLENGEELKQLVQEINSWNGALESFQVHHNDEEFFDIYFEGKPAEVARAISFGDYHYNNDYVRFNGYGNLESLSAYDYETELEEGIEEIIAALIEERSNISIDSELEEILDEDEE